MRGRVKTDGPSAVSVKTKHMIQEEGYRPDVAAAAAHSMARRGTLGARGGYRRKTDRPKGPRGHQRRGM